MFLYWFERIARSVIQTLDEVDEQTKATWALPYWDYWDPRPPGSTAPPPFKDSLPPAFRATNLPNGEPNPLFEVKRNRARPKKDSPSPIRRVAINRGDRLPRQVTSPHRALDQPFFSDPGGLTGGFGGPLRAGSSPPPRRAACGPVTAPCRCHRTAGRQTPPAPATVSATDAPASAPAGH
jgi:tyrosinase